MTSRTCREITDHAWRPSAFVVCSGGIYGKFPVDLGELLDAQPQGKLCSFLPNGNQHQVSRA